MINFGSGKIVAVPKYLADGTPIAVPTPIIMGTLQDVSLDLSVELKTLYGSKRYPIAVGQGKGKTEIKATYAEFDAGILGSLFLGKASSAGIKAAVLDPAAVAVPATPFQLTVTPPSSGTFVEDLGVFNADTGVQLTRVASSPATGEYSVNGSGQYTFASADEGDNVKISYEYSAATGGKVWTLSNETMGYSPSFSVLLQNGYDGKTMVCKLNKAISGQLTVPLKNDDFGIYDFSAEAFDDGTGSLGYICLF